MEEADESMEEGDLTDLVLASCCATSKRVLSCSETTPKARNPTHASPAPMPNRRVSDVATQSVESAPDAAAAGARSASPAAGLAWAAAASASASAVAAPAAAGRWAGAATARRRGAAWRRRGGRGRPASSQGRWPWRWHGAFLAWRE